MYVTLPSDDNLYNIHMTYSKILKVLQESTAFLEGELSKRGIITDTPGGISGAAKLRAGNDCISIYHPL